ncbi:MAG TPA: hypothetical protein PLU30_07485 [Verrucomicrobiae bacterium]|nr:hypothetical protein [Verrucomicrobiae bacterium]
MRAVHFFSVAAMFVCVARPDARAERIQVLEASYGIEGRYADVTQRVQRIADSGRREFEVSNEILGVDPYKGEGKRLRVSYVAGGKRYSDEAREGRAFRFERGGGWACWDPWFQGSWPGATYGRIEFRNEFGDQLDIYHVNDFGRWVFVRQLFDGEGFSARSPHGQTWVVTDKRNRIVRQILCGRGEATIVIRRGDSGPWWGDRGGGTEIRFTNKTGDRIRVSRVDRNGGWDRAAEIGGGGSDRVRFSPGEPWVVTDLRGRLILSGRAGRESQKVEVRD